MPTTIRLPLLGCNNNSGDLSPRRVVAGIPALRYGALRRTGVDQTLHILDVRLEISSDQKSLIEPFLGVFSAFFSESEGSGEAAGARPVQVRVDGAAGTYHDGSRRVALAEGRLRQAHVYNLLYTTLVRALGGYYLLHAAVVARADRAWILSGPSGSGKTSLGRALSERGFSLLTDDLAPLAVADGRLHPFPRRLGLARGAGEATGDYVRLGSKDFVAAADVGLAGPGKPVRPAGVVIMNPYVGAGETPLRLQVGVLPAAAFLSGRLAALPGVTVTSTPGHGGVELLSVTVIDGSAVAAVMAEMDAADAGILFHGHHHGQERRWAREPRLTPMPLREAAIALLRETLNREPRAALMVRHGGRAVSALMELLGLLVGVPCYRLEPAGIAETAVFLEKKFR